MTYGHALGIGLGLPVGGGIGLVVGALLWWATGSPEWLLLVLPGAALGYLAIARPWRR